MRGLNYEKKNWFYIVVCIFAFLFAGCCTCARIKSDATDVIAGNSRATGQLEATITALDATVNDSRERIADIIETSRGIADGVERVEYLFNEYESEVERLLSEIDRIRNEAEIQGESNSDSGNSSFDIHNSEGSLIDTETEIQHKDSLLAESSTLTENANLERI